MKNDLHGMVVSAYGSIASLAKALGWSYAKTYRIVRGVQGADADDIRTLVRALGVTEPETVVELFSLL
ncbi:helix-turn-helix domain-containing protein [Dysosmobacter sp.]|uniref:helix-turn-helix domain-containing protein n=1 Tax=Dysosmobacter sp. TaxID=2591382 RepID=UPI002A97C3DC|nr:helix-turn-helix transcriptional regulator [Dysosmobacter sp.]MDY5509480.1 helix-turn-helix transcriptional regulator [Dysosmobacter sp.]